MKQIKAVLALSLAACSSWRVQGGATPDAVRDDGSGHVRLTLKSGERVELFDARTVGDSVVGLRPRGQRHAVAQDDVASVELLKRDTFLTVLAVVGITAAVLVVAGALAVESAENSCQPTSSYSRPIDG